MKKLILVSWAVMAAHFSVAQEKKQYEVKNFKGLVSIKGPSSGLIIEGHSGTSVIIEAESTEGKVPEKATGMRMVTAGGLDNTGIAATVEEETVKVVTSINEKGEEKEEEVRLLSINIAGTSKLFRNYVIKIPKGLTTRFRESYEDSWGKKGVLKIQSLEGELDVNCVDCSLDVSDFSGNIIANNSSSRTTTKIEFSKLDQNKITSINTDGELEVLLPGDSKANLRMNSVRGNVYTDFDLKKATEKSVREPFEPVVVTGWGSSSSTTMIRSSSGLGSYTIVGEGASSDMDSGEGRKIALASVAAARKSRGRYDYTINGGGVYVSITSYSGNVYLKKK